jgi:hypothetical protein
LEIIVIPQKEITGADFSEELSSIQTPVFGCAKGKFTMSDDFNAPLEDFEEYMQ